MLLSHINNKKDEARYFIIQAALKNLRKVFISTELE